MPNLPRRPCTTPGCKGFAPCAEHERKRRQWVDSRRGTPAERGYTAAWAVYSKARLYRFPLCVDPYGEHGKRLVLATLTDHIVPHKGDRVLFWEPSNHQSMCKPCHDRKTATEDGGFGNRAAQQSKSVSQEAEAWCF